jgi:CheY-like chemotaxis protein/anti-sigma regulatory factor (Ser/Thr protein kinase)
VRLEQVISNLVTNALKYTDGGSVEVTIRREDGAAVMRVRDTGVGITADLMPHIFDLFTQSERSLARSEGGLGIGLTLVRRLVEMHDGNVTIDSGGAGKGTTVTVRLPLAESAAIAADRPPVETPEDAEPLRILVVDDNVDAAEALTDIVEAWGHTARAVFHGQEALGAAARFRPDVVLLDIGLPGMDGYAVARALRADPNQPQPRIVAVTGYGQREDRQRSRAAGFDEHLVKPVDLPSLRRALHTPSASAGSL